jgi:hypothetical protein
MSSYSFRNILTQSPEKVKVTVLAVLGVGLSFAHIDPSLLETVGVGIAIERLLDLFYVAPIKNAQAAAVAASHEEEKTAEALNGIELGKKLAARPLKAHQLSESEEEQQ